MIHETATLLRVADGSFFEASNEARGPGTGPLVSSNEARGP